MRHERATRLHSGTSLTHWNLVGPSGEVLGRRLAGGSWRYYLKDRLGSVRAVIDGSGAVKAGLLPDGPAHAGPLSGRLKPDLRGLHGP